MADFHIYIGYRTVSSWSMRAWLPLRKVGVPFEETLVRYRIPEGKAALVAVSPSGKVPLLVHRANGGEVKIWDSLAIGEYLAELFPKARLWPTDPTARAFARSISAEMHSGFRPLREELSMALLDRMPKRAENPATIADIARIEQIWREARERFGRKEGGRYLFGHFTIADAMYAPIATRFRTYATHVEPMAMMYVETILADPDFQAWEQQAMEDPEPDPEVH